MHQENIFKGHHTIKRDGQVVDFDPAKIQAAVHKAALDVFHGEASQRLHELVAHVTDLAVTALTRDPLVVNHHIEDIQDQVELALMRSNEMELLRGFVVFRHERSKRRDAVRAAKETKTGKIVVIRGVEQILDVAKLAEQLSLEVEGLNANMLPVAQRVEKELFNGADQDQLDAAIRLATRTLIETDPVYDYACARLEIARVYAMVLGKELPKAERSAAVANAFQGLLKQGVEYGLLNPDLLAKFDFGRLGAAIDTSRDMRFKSLAVATLYDRYLVHIEGRRIEVPQTFFMRVAMGLSLNESDPTARAIEFYDVLSTLDFMNSTPTLFNSGLVRSQLASCYLTTVADSLESIYGDGITQNAMLQKFAGGLGNDWTNVRALGALIKGTNGKSEGVIPFLKVVNDTAVAVNQGGKRKGAVCAYLETWHLDIEDFLTLRKNTGDDRRRTHDMNTAHWIPDLFMRRVKQDGSWTLFSPNDVPDLHDLVGAKFEAAYTAYEAKTLNGGIKLFKTLPAKDLWRKMLTMLFETGHPWLTWKDPSNLRSPQQHVGVVHSSNLCTEITLNTSADETAVCNIGSINLVNHLTAEGKLDLAKVRKTTRVAMRMLDNVIDLNYYSVEKARNSNMRHRPVGIGMMGFHDCLQIMGIPFASIQGVQFADASTEALCYYAYEASSDLAVERGKYSTFEGSLWSKGILPLDSIEILRKERGAEFLEIDTTSRLGLDYDALRAKIQKQGMRNSNCCALAPTATIGNIVGVSACHDPIFSNLSVKSNLSGEFTVVNEHLVNALKKLGLWDSAMLADLKFYKGSVLDIDRIPADLKPIYATSFEIGPKWFIEGGARRQKWLDQAQSLNIYARGITGRQLDEVYMLAWLRGLKTTYYLRTLSATDAESSTGKGGELNAVKSGATPTIKAVSMPEPDGAVCMMRPGDPGFEECEACQ